jgi:hypothetical protein
MSNIKFLQTEKYSFEIPSELSKRVKNQIDKITNELGTNIHNGDFSVKAIIENSKIVFTAMVEEPY